MAHDVFISHSSSNRPIANAVCAALETAGIRCWIAPRDVLPGRSYSGEITRAIQQSRAFVLIFSESSNNSEQVLREVQLAANSRLHIVQFRIDAVTPSDDLEYYLSGPHWLDAVTPPLENHLQQLTRSVQALLPLPNAGESGKTAPRGTPAMPPPPPPPTVSAPPVEYLTPGKSTTNIWKWAALAIAGLAALGLVALVLIFTVIRSKPPVTTAPPTQTPAPQDVAAVQPTAAANSESTPAVRPSIAPTSTNSIVSSEQAELYVKGFNRAFESGDIPGAMAYLDDTVDYYSLGHKPKPFIADQMRQYLAAIPIRTFVVGDVKVQAGPKPTVATIIYETRYSVRDVFGTASTGRTRSEWDVVRRAEGLKIIRTNWITYPDPSPAP